MASDVAIFGAGAWGTALASHLAARSTRNSHVMLWTRSSDHADALRGTRQNSRYLAGVTLPPALAITAQLDDAASARTLIVATPAAALLDVGDAIAATGPSAPLAWLSKGFVNDDRLPSGVGLAHQVIGPRWPSPVGVISGPSFAEEVAHGLPTALVAAATEREFARELADLLRGGTL